MTSHALTLSAPLGEETLNKWFDGSISSQEAMN